MDTYSNPLRVTYSFPAQNFTTPITRAIKPPPGCTRGRLRDIHCSVTTTFTQTTTPGHVQVGVNGNAAKYADLNMGAADAGSAYSTVDMPNSIVKGGIDLDRDGITQIQVATVAPTGGSPAGVADITITIDWS